MKKIFDLNKEIVSREGKNYFLDEVETKATVGNYLVRILDTAADKGEEARRCVNIANIIDKAIKDKKNFAEVDNGDIDFVKNRVEKSNFIPYIQILLSDVFDKSEKEYQNRNNKK